MSELSSNWNSFRGRNGGSRARRGSRRPRGASHTNSDRGSETPPPQQQLEFVPVFNVDSPSLGKYVAVDCEFVGCGPKGSVSRLGRISIVDFHGNVILDTFVQPPERVTNWRTWISGVSPRHMKKAISFQRAQELACDLLSGRILVGHAVMNDLKVLEIEVPKAQIRDTANYEPFRRACGTKCPSLKALARLVLGKDIQGGQHSSVEDAQITMELFRLMLSGWTEG